MEFITDLISVSSVIDNGHKAVHEKKTVFLLEIRRKSTNNKKKKTSLLTPDPKARSQLFYVGGQTELWHKRMGHLKYKDLRNLLPMDFSASDEKCQTC